MKKLLVALVISIFIALLIIYYSIPSKVNFSETVFIKVNRTNATRLIMNESNWGKWWPEKNSKDGKTGKGSNVYKNFSYYVNMKLLKGDSIVIKNKSWQINSFLNIIPVSIDSIAVQWFGQSSTASNGFKKFKNYFQINEVKDNVDDLLHSMKLFLEKEENLYGLAIDQVKVKDTLLIATQYSSPRYPATAEIYALINQLKDFIKKQGAIETNYPMLHVIESRSGFKTMVAIPVNKILHKEKKFLFRRMVPGKILIAEVKGGTYTAENAVKQIEMYMNDYHLVAPAIPFQSLVTDRSKEPDTAKWVTRIFYPVM